MTTVNNLIVSALRASEGRILSIAGMIEKAKLTGKITIEINMNNGGIGDVKIQFSTSEKVSS